MRISINEEKGTELEEGELDTVGPFKVKYGLQDFKIKSLSVRAPCLLRDVFKDYFTNRRN